MAQAKIADKHRNLLKNDKKPAGKSWKDTNRVRKEQLKKLKADRTVRRLEKAKLKAAAEQEETKKQKEIKQVSTISLAIPGSIMENAQSAELRTYLAGQVARAACIFQVDELVVFDDMKASSDARKSAIDDEQGTKVTRHSCVQLGRILQYLECPQYLRKHFFPIHNDLKYAGILNPLDAPHHLREHNIFMFREGVVTNKPVKSGRGSLVNVGLRQDVYVDKLITPGVRCTVKLEPQQEGSKKLHGKIVAPSAPRLETGVYWGYNVRIANSLSQVFSQSPFKNGYDLTIGTSDKGESVDEYSSRRFNHALIVFGGLDGLEASLESDEVLKAEDPALLFDCYLNTVPNQGSRTVRTEEALLITMAALRSKLNPRQSPMEFRMHEEIAQSSISTSPNKFSGKGEYKKLNVQSSMIINDDDMSRFD